jgi:hypothetical protein
MKKKASETETVPFDLRNEEVIRVLKTGVYHCHTISDDTKEKIMLFVTEREDELDEEAGRDPSPRGKQLEEEITPAVEGEQPIVDVGPPPFINFNAKGGSTESDAADAERENQEPPLYKQRGGNI